MKIPTYNNQVKMTDRVAAQRMNVQANSSAFEGPGQAVAALGKQVAAQASWMEQEQKLVNASEVASAKRLYASDLIQLENDIAKDPAYNTNPASAKTRFDTKSKQLFKTRSLKVVGNLAKTTFNTEAENLKSPSRLRTTKLARSRLVSENIVGKLTEASDAEKKLALLDPKSQDYKELLESIIGAKDTLGNVITPGVFGELARNGSIKAEDQSKYERKFLSNVSRNTVNKLLLGASTDSGSKIDLATGSAGKQAMLVYNQLQDPNQHANLTAIDRTKLSEEALRLTTQLDSRRISLFNQNESREKTERTDNQKTNFNSLVSRIQKYRADPSNTSLQATQVTTLEVNQMLENGDISVSQQNAVIKALNTQGAIVSDKAYISNVIGRITKADNKQEIKKVVDEAFTHINTKLNYQDLTVIRQTAEQFNSSTPSSKRAKIFDTLLESLVRPTGVIDRIFPGASKRGKDVIAGYRLKILEGIPPVQAFNESIDSFKTNEKVILKEIPLPMFKPPLAQTEISSPNVESFNTTQSGPVKRDLSTWTLYDVAWSRQKVRTEYVGRVGSLAREEFRLNMLELYIQQRNAAEEEIAVQSSRNLTDAE
tara:strand:+ start:2630 stop:4423 length:1794 start_codon:yes stop_codon:yes gene_type:complete